MSITSPCNHGNQDFGPSPVGRMRSCTASAVFLFCLIDSTGDGGVVNHAWTLGIVIAISDATILRGVYAARHGGKPPGRAESFLGSGAGENRRGSRSGPTKLGDDPNNRSISE